MQNNTEIDMQNTRSRTGEITFIIDQVDQPFSAKKSTNTVSKVPVMC